MNTEPDPAVNAERQQTDESLRIEREKADAALAENTALVDEIADGVIVRARLRADGLLAAARARTDRQENTSSSTELTPAVLVRERRREDRVLAEERADADEILREERADHVALLAAEREETDKDLVRERGRADEAVATRDEFLGMVSHDLRTLLNQVMGFAALITMELSGKKDLQQIAEDADRIERSGNRMNRLVGDLVDVASIHAGTLAVAPYEDDPARAVTEAVDAFQPQAVSRGISLNAELGAPTPPVTFDHARILQVLTNLLSNAIKFTPRGGTVVVRVVRVGAEVCFSVTDTGLGIPADKLESIFERYVQVSTHDRRGVGLGLYISKCIVLGHGGRIWARSVLGEGSTFSFALPLEG